MTLLAKLRAAAEAVSGTRDGARCGADWRRPEGYWRCARPAGHRGRHRMVGVDPEAMQRDRSGERPSRSGEGGVVAG